MKPITSTSHSSHPSQKILISTSPLSKKTSHALHSKGSSDTLQKPTILTIVVELQLAPTTVLNSKFQTPPPPKASTLTTPSANTKISAVHFRQPLWNIYGTLER